MAIGAFPMSVGSSDNHITHIYGLPKVEATRVAYGETVLPGANPPLEPIMALKVWDFFTREVYQRLKTRDWGSDPKAYETEIHRQIGKAAR